MLCAASRGFVYAVTVAGITGGAKELPPEVPAYLERVRALTTLPVCAGFGVRRAEQVRNLAPHTDGVIVGSALVEHLEAGKDPVEFLKALRPVPVGAPSGATACPPDATRPPATMPTPAP